MAVTGCCDVSHSDGSWVTTNPNSAFRDMNGNFIRMATEKSLARCGTDHFDCLMLHNPDSIGYSSDAVWKAMRRMQEEKLTDMLGVAPGPAM